MQNLANKFFAGLTSAKSTLHIPKMFASGRWWPQPQCCLKSSFSTNSSVDKFGDLSCKSDREVNDSKIVNKVGDNDKIELSREKAAPVYADLRIVEKKVYRVTEGKGGELLADYVLFEDSMEKSKIPWNDYSLLTSEERAIYMAHLKAVRERRLTYKDPFTSAIVMTVSKLLLTDCCGNGCRHCPYGHENATPEIRKSRKWNGAFYT